MKSLYYILVSICMCMVIACSNPRQEKTTLAAGSQFEMTSLPDSAIVKIAGEAYVFGYPLVLMDLSKKVLTNVETFNGKEAPVNVMAHMSAFPDHTFTAVVKPNNDTYYSLGWFDLKSEPLVLTVPASERYYLLPMLDAYTNVFASPGHRTTGKGAHIFLVAGPGWKAEEIPTGMELISAPTNTVWLIGRTQVNSKEDGRKVVVPFQSNMKLVPLSSYGKSYVAPKGTVVPEYSKIVPVDDAAALSTEAFFNYLSELMVDNPPALADSAIVKRMASIGLVAGKAFTMDGMRPELKEKLSKVPAAVLGKIKGMAASKDPSRYKNGWAYNTKPLGDFGTNYGIRAMTALVGLGANLPEDAIYPMATQDSEGQPLHSDHQYVVHFEKDQMPPVNAFWSLTMYNSLDFLAENPISRYAIGDRDKLKYNKDGSLDIYVQRTAPEKTKESNWLPAPKEGIFNLTLRMYWPKQAAIDKTWMPPVVKRMR